MKKNYKKIIALGIILILVISCGKAKKDNGKKVAKGADKVIEEAAKKAAENQKKDDGKDKKMDEKIVGSYVSGNSLVKIYKEKNDYYIQWGELDMESWQKKIDAMKEKGETYNTFDSTDVTWGNSDIVMFKPIKLEKKGTKLYNPKMKQTYSVVEADNVLIKIDGHDEMQPILRRLSEDETKRMKNVKFLYDGNRPLEGTDFYNKIPIGI
jgi:lipoprotein